MKIITIFGEWKHMRTGSANFAARTAVTGPSVGGKFRKDRHRQNKLKKMTEYANTHE